MKNKKVYIFNSESRAAVYGIGTYINQLTMCLKHSKIDFDIIFLHTKGYEVTISMEKGVRQISIPLVPYRKPEDDIYYYRNVVYLLDDYIPKLR